MRSSITVNQMMPEVFLHESSDRQDESISNADTDLASRIAELEDELRKKKAAAEKGAKLMQIIWGDQFQSDSLH